MGEGSSSASHPRAGRGALGVLRLPARRRRSAGSTLFETTFAFPAFIILLLATFDVGYIFYLKTSLQHAVREAGRMAQTGAVLVDPNNSKKTLSRADSIIAMIKSQSGVAVATSQVTLNTVNDDGSTTPGPGGPGDVISLRVKYEVSLVTPILGKVFPASKYTVDVGTSFRNEEF